MITLWQYFKMKFSLPSAFLCLLSWNSCCLFKCVKIYVMNYRKFHNEAKQNHFGQKIIFFWRIRKNFVIMQTILWGSMHFTKKRKKLWYFASCPRKFPKENARLFQNFLKPSKESISITSPLPPHPQMAIISGSVPHKCLNSKKNIVLDRYVLIWAKRNLVILISWI